MKKIFIFFCFLNVSLQSVDGQNIYDPYLDYNTSSTLPPSYFSQLVSGTGFSGEYQWFVRENSVAPYYNHWAEIAKTDPADPEPYSMSYKIEVVSFPFAPSVASTTSTTRVLHAYGDSDYNATSDNWDGRVERLVRNSYAPLSGALSNSKSINGPSTVVSFEFKNPGGLPSGATGRILYPHSVLKHTLYIYCNSSMLGKPIDSLEFVVDLTRGRMRYYPFYDLNYLGTTAPSRYDVLLATTLNMPGNFSATTNELEPWNPYVNGVQQSTINYFPYPYGTDVCGFPGVKYFPTAEDFPPFSVAPNPIDFVHPPPYSLSGFEILNGQGDEPVGYNYSAGLTALVQKGILHEYQIAQPLDLTIINPSQKVIYNPSETKINLNNPSNTTGIYTLTFPSGYVFKTVDGIYPSQSQVLAADPDRLFNDFRQIPSQSTLTDDPLTALDETKSYYYINSGSKLKIESCVGIYDAVIVIQPGGELEYDPSQIYGNYSVQNAGGTETIISLPTATNCAHDCYNLVKYDVKDLTIFSDATWNPPPMTGHPYDFNNDGKLTIAGTLTVMSGKTLTITGSYLYEFGQNAGVVVQKGAKLIVDGATFTSAGICADGMWNGIRVLGDGALFQTVANQGLAQFTNAKISNSRAAAIQTGSGPDGGGIIRCQNVEFQNNRVSAAFGSYKNKPSSLPTAPEYNNVSYFKDCQFLTTSYLNDPIYKEADGRPFTVAHITMYDVKNVRIENCLFENSALKPDGTQLFDNDLRGAGIISYDSQIKLSGGSLQNQFKGLSDGVWALSTGQPDLVWIDGTSFVNVVHGITLEATQYSSVNQNTFEIPRHETNDAILSPSLKKGYGKPYGVYFVGATNFTTQENVFNYFDTPTTNSVSPSEYNYGMVVKNCSGSDPAIPEIGSGLGYAYKNEFGNVNINLQTELDNRGTFDLTAFPSPVTSGGLEYECNEFNTRINFDVTVPDGPPGSGLASLIRDQGFCVSTIAQAGNSYTACATGSSEQLDFGGTSEVLNTPFAYRDQPGIFQCTDLSSSIVPCVALTGTNSCLSNFDLCATIPCLTTYYQDALINIEQSLLSYQQLVDGGNTSALMSAISSSMSAGTLKNLLLSKSPYLSDEVLKATLNRPDLPPYGHLEQIFIANSPVTESVLAELLTKNLPSGIVENISAAQHGISARSEKEREVNYYAFQSKLQEVNLIQGFLKIDDPDSLKAIQSRDSTIAGLYKYLKFLIDKGYYADAHVCLNKIHASEGSTHTDQCKLNGIRLYLSENNLSWMDMTTNQLNIIKQIYQNNPETAIEARAILSLTKGLKYEVYPFDVVNEKSMNADRQTFLTNEDNFAGLKIYPNPSSDFAKVEVRLEEKMNNARLVVYNLLGAIVTERHVENGQIYNISTSEFSNGIYLFVLTSDLGVIEKEKIVVSK